MVIFSHIQFRIIIITLFFIFSSTTIFSQKPPLDSLEIQKIVDSAILFKKEYKYDLAIKKMQRALEVSYDTPFNSLTYIITGHLSRIYILNGQYDLGLKYLNNQLDYINLHAEFSSSKEKVLNNISIAYYYKGDYHQAIIYALEALHIAEYKNDLDFLITVYSNLGNLYRITKQPKNAIKILKKSIRLSKTQENLTVEASALNNLGLVYRDQKTYDSAYFYLNAAIKLKKQIKSTTLASTYHSLSSLFIKTDRFEQSLTYLKLALEANKDHNNQNGIIHDYLGLGNYYYTLKQNNKAKDYYDKALLLARKTKNLDLVAQLQLKYSALFEEEKNYQASLNAYKEADRIMDSLNSIAREKEAIQIKVLYESEKKDHELAIIKNELSSKNNRIAKQRLFIFLAVLGCIILGLILYILRNRFITSKILLDQQLQNTQNALQSTQDLLIQKQEERDQIALKLKSRIKDSSSDLKAQLTASEKEIQDLKVFYDLRKQMQQTLSHGKHDHMELSQLKDMISNLFIEQKHLSFITTLKQNYPTLTDEDLRLCAAIKQRLLNSEIAIFLQISTNTLYTRKSRLKQKLSLKHNEDLNSFIHSFS